MYQLPLPYLIYGGLTVSFPTFLFKTSFRLCQKKMYSSSGRLLYFQVCCITYYLCMCRRRCGLESVWSGTPGCVPLGRHMCTAVSTRKYTWEWKDRWYKDWQQLFLSVCFALSRCSVYFLNLQTHATRFASSNFPDTPKPHSPFQRHSFPYFMFSLLSVAIEISLGRKHPPHAHAKEDICLLSKQFRGMEVVWRAARMIEVKWHCGVFFSFEDHKKDRH